MLLKIVYPTDLYDNAISKSKVKLQGNSLIDSACQFFLHFCCKVKNNDSVVE